MAEVLVADNARVTAGQVLVRIDDAPLRAKLAQAEANAAALDAAVRAVDDKARLEQAMIAQKAAGVDCAHAQSQLAQAELARYGSLATSRAGSRPSAPRPPRPPPARPRPGSPRPAPPWRPSAAARASLGSARAQTLAQAHAAHAAVEQARIDLDRTQIKAPVAGRGGRSRRASRPVCAPRLGPDERRAAGRGLCDRQLQGDPGRPACASASP